MNKLQKSFLVLFTLTMFWSYAYSDEIVMAADPWPPFAPGYMIDIAEEVFTKNGHTFKFEVMPWSRAIIEARTGNVNGIIGAARGDAPDFVFPENEQGQIVNTFFVNKGSSWTYTGIESLKSVKLGLILDYDYSEEISEYVKNQADSKLVQFIGGNAPLSQNIKKLKAGRIDVTLEASTVFNFTANEMGESGSFKVGGVLEDTPESSLIYMAFSPANPNSAKYAKILSDGMTELRTSGRLAEILKKYGLKDWK
jgi:polar amino acid transport system substrate-binding protein